MTHIAKAAMSHNERCMNLLLGKTKENNSSGGMEHIV